MLPPLRRVFCLGCRHPDDNGQPSPSNSAPLGFIQVRPQSASAPKMQFRASPLGVSAYSTCGRDGADDRAGHDALFFQVAQPLPQGAGVDALSPRDVVEAPVAVQQRPDDVQRPAPAQKGQHGVGRAEHLVPMFPRMFLSLARSSTIVSRLTTPHAGISFLPGFVKLFFHGFPPFQEPFLPLPPLQAMYGASKISVLRKTRAKEQTMSNTTTSRHGGPDRDARGDGDGLRSAGAACRLGRIVFMVHGAQKVFGAFGGPGWADIIKMMGPVPGRPGRHRRVLRRPGHPARLPDPLLGGQPCGHHAGGHRHRPPEERLLHELEGKQRARD